MNYIVVGMAAGYTNNNRPSENKVGHIVNMEVAL